jgi:hypothetical protein
LILKRGSGIRGVSCVPDKNNVNFKGKELMVTSPQIPLEDYPNDELPIDLVINAMVGDLQRIEVYPGKGFQIPQEIPEKVWKSYEALVAMGYDQHLI